MKLKVINLYILSYFWENVVSSNDAFPTSVRLMSFCLMVVLPNKSFYLMPVCLMSVRLTVSQPRHQQQRWSHHQHWQCFCIMMTSSGVLEGWGGLGFGLGSDLDLGLEHGFALMA